MVGRSKCLLVQSLEYMAETHHYTVDVGKPRMLAPVLAQIEGRIIALEWVLRRLVELMPPEQRNKLRSDLRREIASLPQNFDLPEDVYKAARPPVRSDDFRNQSFANVLQDLVSGTFTQGRD